jgi:hypothetical protein
MIDPFPSVRLTRVDSDELVVIIYDEWAPGGDKLSGKVPNTSF